MDGPDNNNEIKLLSYNIQAGASADRYSDYVTRSWQHVLPHANRVTKLDDIAQTVQQFDIVGLQEADDGSLRTGFVNQTRYLAERGGFPFWSLQSNRKLSKLASTCNALLTRMRPDEVHDFKLPGRIPGRGALLARFGEGDCALAVVVIHLALGRRARATQLSYVAELLADYRHAVVMGDMNATVESPEIEKFLSSSNLIVPDCGRHTFPSWRPNRRLDHIFVSDGIKVTDSRVLACEHSDHLPVATHIALPDSCSIGPRTSGQEVA